MPEQFGWLLRLGTWRVAPYRRELERLLADPEMAALLRAAPQAGRILRPLCRMLAIKPDPALLPAPPKRPARAEPAPAEAAATESAPKPPRKHPIRTEPYRRKPTRAPEPGTVWRKWRGNWMPETIRKPEPA